MGRKLSRKEQINILTEIPKVGDFITLKHSNNIYCPKDARFKVLSINKFDEIVNVELRGNPYLVHIDNIKTIDRKERVDFT
jgi:hypothetical protein